MDRNSLEILLILSTILEFNPLFQAIKGARRKSMKDVSVWTFLSILIIGALWLYYGLLIGSVPLIVANSIKLFTAVVVVIMYVKYEKFDKAL
jgi:MtN3 and saliva related transmembrane protein